MENSRPLFSTMPDYPLTVNAVFEHGAHIYSDSEVVTSLGATQKRATFSQVALRVRRLASALQTLGVNTGDRIGTLSWNSQEHLEAFFAIPSMGAVMCPLNIRFSPQQLEYVINFAEIKTIIVQDAFLPILERIKDKTSFVEKIIVVGDSNSEVLKNVLSYEELLAEGDDYFRWREIDERSAASLCFTGGTTGNPKGVVYSHRSEYLHSVTQTSAAALSLNQHDRVLMIAPMFHANAWGIPYSSWLAGADIIMPGRSMQPEQLAGLIESERATFAGGSPVIWNGLLNYSETHQVDFGSLREVICGGSATPRTLIERFQKELGVKMIQAWGMVETSAPQLLSHPPKNGADKDEFTWRSYTGRVLPWMQLRLMDGENELNWDGISVGEIQVKGPYVTADYYKSDSNENFQDGWLRTGDMGTVEANGFVQITDRIKDVIKSGGEWISSVELEDAIVGHPGVFEVAVVAVADEKWGERPLVCVVPKPNQHLQPEDLSEFIKDKIVSWWMPERWTFVEEIPKTAMGKFDKGALRAKYSANEFEIIVLK